MRERAPRLREPTPHSPSLSLSLSLSLSFYLSLSLSLPSSIVVVLPSRRAAAPSPPRRSFLSHGSRGSWARNTINSPANPRASDGVEKYLLPQRARPGRPATPLLSISHVPRHHAVSLYAVAPLPPVPSRDTPFGPPLAPGSRPRKVSILPSPASSVRQELVYSRAKGIYINQPCNLFLHFAKVWREYTRRPVRKYPAYAGPPLPTS